MIGVILWSSPPKEKAVIWCEDHGALAYLQGQENLAFPGEWPEAGDLVELEWARNRPRISQPCVSCRIATLARPSSRTSWRPLARLFASGNQAPRASAATPVRA